MRGVPKDDIKIGQNSDFTQLWRFRSLLLSNLKKFNVFLRHVACLGDKKKRRKF